MESAIDKAVKQCVDEGVLTDFLLKYGKEARRMLYHDISKERFAEIRGEERWEEGRQSGRAEGTDSAE